MGTKCNNCDIPLDETKRIPGWTTVMTAETSEWKPLCALCHDASIMHKQARDLERLAREKKL